MERISPNMKTKDSKEIYERQNHLEAIQYLRAMRQEYNHSRKLSTALWLFSVVIPIIGAVISVLNINSKIDAIIIALSLVFSILLLVLSILINHSKILAATLQFKFEMYVFDYKEPKNNKLFKRAKVTDIKKSLSRHKDKEDSTLLNWYKDYSNHPYEVCVFYCQSESLVWDKSIRLRYLITITAFLIVIIVSIVISAIIFNDSLLNLLSILSTLLPIFSYGARTIILLVTNLRTEDYLENMVSNFEDDYIKKGKTNSSKIQEFNYDLNHCIYDYRKELHLIPNKFYLLYRKKLHTYFGDIKNI